MRLPSACQVESLLRQGVPVDIIDEHGNTFLVVAAQNGHKRIAKIALRQGANMDHQNVSELSVILCCKRMKLRLRCLCP